MKEKFKYDIDMEEEWREYFCKEVNLKSDKTTIAREAFRGGALMAIRKIVMKNEVS
jgi:hypothetical protein